MSITSYQRGFGAVGLLATVVVVGAVVVIGVVVFSNQTPTPQTNNDTTTASTDTGKEVTIPAGFRQFSNEDAGFDISYPSEWGALRTQPNTGDTATGPSLDRLATDSPGSVLSGSMQVTVTPKTTFSIKAERRGPTVVAIKKDGQTVWQVQAVAEGDTRYVMGDAFKPKTITTTSGFTATDFTWVDELTTHSRWVLDVGTTFVTIELPYLWTPSIEGAVQTPEADLRLYLDLSKAVINTAQ